MNISKFSDTLPKICLLNILTPKKMVSLQKVTWGGVLTQSSNSRTVWGVKLYNSQTSFNRVRKDRIG